MANFTVSSGVVSVGNQVTAGTGTVLAGGTLDNEKVSAGGTVLDYGLVSGGTVSR